MRGLRKYLLEEYGNEVRQHFNDFNNSQYTTSNNRKRNYNTQRASIDNDTKDFILNMNHNNQYSKCMIEGIELVDKLMRINDKTVAGVSSKII